MPATASDETNASRIVGSSTLARRIAASARAVERSKRESPDASAMSHSGKWHVCVGKRRADDTGAVSRRAARSDGRAEFLQQHLGGEVVALAVHQPEDPRELLGEVECDDECIVGCPTRARRTSDRDSMSLESLRVGTRGSCGRSVRAVDGDVADSQRRQRPRFDAEVGGFPAEPVSARIEVRVVAEHAASNTPDPSGCESSSEPVEVGLRQCRVTEADEPEVAVPDVARSRPACEDLSPEPVVRAENVERRERNSQLLCRGG